MSLLNYQVPFCQLLQLSRLHHFTEAHLCSPLYFISFSTATYVIHVLWLWCKAWATAVLAGAFLIFFFAWNVSQMFEELEVKQSVVIHLVKATHPLLYQ